MAKPKPLPKVKLIAGLFYQDKGIYDKTKTKLIECFGEIDFESDEYGFSKFTDYYEDEIGKELKKKIISFKEPIDRDDLAEIKQKSNEIEDFFSTKGKRTINIDTGYLTKHNIILASAKEMPHKVSIGGGYFGDVVLTYRNGGYKDYFRTFPDHRYDKVKGIYIKIRKIYIEQINLRTNSRRG